MFIQENYRIQFVTPGFVGDADQSGEWRTPPFKALLRRWWRVVWWHQQANPSVEGLRNAEGALFGWAADTGGGAKASQVRIRLDRWQPGQLQPKGFNQYQFSKVVHPEITIRPNSALYLGYGPIGPGGLGGSIKKTAIAVCESNNLQIICRRNAQAEIHTGMKLMALFGAVGGRSRNGWGSIWVEPKSSDSCDWVDLTAFFDPRRPDGRKWLHGFTTDLKTSMGQDWSSSLGKDQKGLLLWTTPKANRWEEIIKILAIAKIAFRTQFEFRGGEPHRRLCDRHILAYPVTKHSLRGWGKDSRLANQILFKILPDGNSYRGLVVQLPHTLPGILKARLDSEDRDTFNTKELHVWSEVHKQLDDRLIRLP